MSLKRNVIANYLGTGWTSIMGLIFVPYYIRYLGMEAYGLIGFYAILQNLLTMLDLGMSPTLNREMARFTGGEHSPEYIRDLLRSLEIICFFIAGIYVFSIWLCADWVSQNWLQANKLPIDVVTRAFQVMGLVTALRFVESIYRSTLIGLQHQVILNITSAIMATLRGFGAVLILAFVSPSINAYFFWQGIISFATLLCFIFFIYRRLPRINRSARFSFDGIKEVWRFAAGVMVTTLLSLLITQVDKIILSKILPLEHFGNYSLAVLISSTLIILVGPISQSHSPKLAELISRNDLEGTRLVFHRGSQLATTICGSAAFTLIFFGERILLIWTGNAELSTQIFPLLQIMAIGTFFNCLMHVPHNLQLAYGWSSLAAKVNLFAVLFLVPAIVWFAPIYGSMGAAIIWAIFNIGNLVILSTLMFRKILVSEKYSWLFKDILIPGIAGITTVLLFFYLKPVFDSKVVESAYITFSAGITALTSTLFSNELRNYAQNNWLKK